jgi:hypothetical protein
MQLPKNKELFMKVIDNSFVGYISGGRGGNTGDYRSERNRNSRGAPDTCANQAGVNSILGGIVGILGGPAGMAVGAAFTGITTAVACPRDTSQNSSGRGRNQSAFGGNSNRNSVNGQCLR